jgi:prenyltransferase beta subunit
MTDSIKLKRSCLLLFLWLGMFVASSGVFAFDTSECVQKGIAYLHNVQNEDGGFPSDKGRESSPMVTDWVVMALRAAGEDLDDVKWSKKGLTPSVYLLKQVRPLESTTDYARTLLALTATDNGTVIQGIDLAEKIVSWQLPHGQFAQSELGEEVLLSSQIWSVLALTAANQEIPQREKVLSWLVNQQNSDGGFSWAVGGQSDPDDTGVALSALAALGLAKDDLVVNKALHYLKEQQNKDGGFSWTDQKTNAATDSWVIQGLAAVGEDPVGNNWRVQGISPLDHLCSLQNSDGSFQWVSGLDSSPVLMTAYALLALSGGSLPVNLTDSKNLVDDVQEDMTVQQNNSTVDYHPEENENLVKLFGDMCGLLKKMLITLPQFLWL